MNGFIGKGTLYLDRLTSAGVSTGFAQAGNATKFEIKPDAEIKELVSRKRETAGQTLASVAKQNPSALSITLNELDHATLALAFMGDTAVINVAGSTVTDEPITAIHGKAVDLAHRGVSAVVVTDATGVTTYVADTDYTVDARLGMITALAAGAITDGQALLVDYAYAAETGHRITGATQPTIKCYLRLDGENEVDGKPCLVDVYEAQLKPSSPVDFLAEDFATLELEGTLITPAGKDHPFKVDMLD